MALLPVSYETAQKVNYALLFCLISAGVLSESPKLWYRNFAKAYVVWVFGSLGTAWLFQQFASKFGTLIQTSPTAQKARLSDEIKETLLGFGFVTAGCCAWPMTRATMGHPIAFRDNLEDCAPYGSAVLYLVKAFVGLLFADAYNYWKHRAFHHRNLWSFHKTHHSHHNPSSMGGFAVSPIYALATFWPLLLFSRPELGLYLPLHWPILVFYMLLNHYLHCGHTFECVEKVFRPLYIMSSGWHNVHHEKGRMGWNYKPQTFGEMLTLWDYICGSHAQGVYLYAGGKDTSKNSD